jgi:hypothetical protein
MDGVDLNANFKFVLRQINKLRIVASLDRTVVSGYHSLESVGFRVFPR